ncbi:MAG: replicative DNA helicase [Clostridiales bacterium]|nr:replicative DNA helicase [Bacillota bacterium]MBR6484977.1 replicative DNA helicase [Clostridiales bacterium]
MAERELKDNLATGPAERPSVPLHDVETEKALLSLCIRNKEALDSAVGKRIVKENFSDKRNALIFEAITKLYMNNGSIDRFNVCEQLEKMGAINSAGGTEYVFAVANTASVASNADSYIESIREKSSMRQVVNTLKDLEKKASSGTNDVNDIIDLAVSRLTPIRENNDGVGFEGLNAILKRNINEIHAISSGKEKVNSVKTGFRGLDAMLGGFRPGTLNIIAARPGMGKTALVINIATNVAVHRNYNVNIFSLEMSKSEIGNRILASRASTTAKELQRAKISPEKEQELAKVFGELSGLPIYIDDNSDVSPVTMLSKCKDLKAKGMLGLVIVDYLQLMTMPGRANSSRQQEISDISRSLKVLAKDMGVPVIALSQLSRGSEKRDDHTPMLSDLRDSGAIEQDADSVIFIDRADYYKKDEVPEIQDAKLIVAKNRHGETGKVHVKWWGAKTLFFEENRKYDPVDPTTTGQQSSYTRTTSSEASASDYNFEDEEPPFAPVSDEDVPVNEENEDFFADSNDSFPDGF